MPINKAEEADGGRSSILPCGTVDGWHSVDKNVAALHELCIRGDAGAFAVVHIGGLCVCVVTATCTGSGSSGKGGTAAIGDEGKCW
jgi:hypothetical protein